MANPLDCNGQPLQFSSGCYDGQEVITPICYQINGGPVLNGFKRITLNADCTASATEILDSNQNPVANATEVGCITPTGECCDPDSICSLLAELPVTPPGPDPVVYVGPGGCYLAVPPGAMVDCAAIQVLFPSAPPLLATDEVLVNRAGTCVRAPVDCAFIQSLFPVDADAQVGDEFLAVRAGACTRVTLPAMADLCDQIAALDPISPAVGTFQIPIRSPGDNLCQTITVQDICDFCTAAVAFPLLADDGSCAAPSYSFTNNTASGMFLIPGGAGAVVIGWNNCDSSIEVSDIVTIEALNGDTLEIGASINLTTAVGAITLNPLGAEVVRAEGTQLLGQDGTIGAPLYSFVNATASGLRYDTGDDELILQHAGGIVDIDGSGIVTIGIPTTQIQIGSSGAVELITASGGRNLTLTSTGEVNINSSVGTAGQVFTSAGAGAPAVWTTPAAVPGPATTVTTSLATAGAVGVATTYAREDHRHQVSTAAPTVTVKSEATAASVGTAATLLRSDAQLQAQTAVPSVAVLSDASTFLQGTSSSLLRADARLIATTAAPVATGTANAQGTATSLARSDHVHRTLVAVQSGGAAVASRPTLNFISGTGITVTPVDNGGSDRVDITIAASGGAAVIQRITFQADQFDSPVNSDWAVNALAPAAAGTINAAIVQRRFDDTAEEGVGGMFTIPTGTVSIVFLFKSRAQTAPVAARTVGNKFYKRTIPDNAAVTAWTSVQLNNIDIPTNTNWQYDTQTVTLATLGLTAGNLVQFELTRTAPTAGTNLTGDWNLAEMQLQFI